MSVFLSPYVGFLKKELVQPEGDPIALAENEAAPRKSCGPIPGTRHVASADVSFARQGEALRSL